MGNSGESPARREPSKGKAQQGESPALPNALCDLSWVRVGTPHCPTQARPTLLCPALGLFLLYKMRRPILPAISTPPLQKHWNRPSFSRGFLPRCDGLCSGSSLSAPTPPSLGYFHHHLLHLPPGTQTSPSKQLPAPCFRPQLPPAPPTLLCRRGSRTSGQAGGEGLAGLLGCSRQASGTVTGI